jgi:hypothetical protein
LAKTVYQDAKEEDAVATGNTVSSIHIWEITWESFHFYK